MRIAINGFGRIGRMFFRQAFGKPDLDIIALNDLGDINDLAYLLKYDTVYRRYEKNVEVKGNKLIIEGREITVFQEKDPVKLPWKDLSIDVVIESTGVFDSSDKAKAHLDAGAKRVVITAPAKDETTPTATPNVNIEHLTLAKITSNASCTTNATTPVAEIMMRRIGVKKAILNTTHGYTATQGLVDGPAKKDFRRGRAAGQNIVPSTTGAAEAAIRAIPGLQNKFDGMAIRVPVVSGSLIDFTFLAQRPTSVEEVNNIFIEESKKLEWQGILKVTSEPLVSSDILGEPYGSIVDLSLTRVVDGDLVKVSAWYDNEWGYGAMLVKHVEALKTLL